MEATSATGEGVSTRCLPMLASLRVTTPRIETPLECRKLSVSAALAGVPANTTLNPAFKLNHISVTHTNL